METTQAIIRLKLINGKYISCFFSEFSVPKDKKNIWYLYTYQQGRLNEKFEIIITTLF